MKEVEKQKKRLEQKKNRLTIEENKLKVKERKARNRQLIDNGRLITKAGLDHLPTNALYGALLSLKEELNNNDLIASQWIVKGNKALNKEKLQATAVILKFANEPEKTLRDFIRSLGMRFNRFRSEWYGDIKEMDKLKNCLENVNHKLEVIDEDK